MVTSTRNHTTSHAKKAVRDAAFDAECRRFALAVADALPRGGDLMDRLVTSPRVWPERRPPLAIVPATRGRDRIIEHKPLMQPTYDLMRAQIRAVE